MSALSNTPGDLKLENFVLDGTRKVVKLVDFGLSIVWREAAYLSKSYGSPCYMAPEIVARRPYLGPPVDARPQLTSGPLAAPPASRR